MRIQSLLFAVACSAAVMSAEGQECVGIPAAAKGFLAVGVAGTDGAGGNGLQFAYERPGGSLLIESQSLGIFAHANPQITTGSQLSIRVKGMHGCVVTGASWTSWNTEGSESRSWSSADPNVFVERHSVGGSYTRLRFPLGVSFGHTLGWKRVSFAPFVNPFVAWESESFRSNEPNAGPAESRTSFDAGFTTGFAMRAGWFMMRPTVSTIRTGHRDALSGQHIWPSVAMHFGVLY